MIGLKLQHKPLGKPLGNYLLSTGGITAINLSVETEVIDHRTNLGEVWIETQVRGDYFCNDPPDTDLSNVIRSLYRQTYHSKSPPDLLIEEAVEQHEQMIQILGYYCFYISTLPCMN